MRRAASVWIAAGVVLGLACGATAGVYDDVKAWWHLDLADSGVITNAGDIRDARDWFNPGGYKATSVQGTPEWTTAVPSQGPGGGQIYGGRGMDFTPAVDTGGNVTPDGFHVSGTDGLALAGDATLLFRLNWRGYPSDQTSTWIYRNAYGADQGWLFGLVGADASPALLRYRTATQGGSLMPTTAWETEENTWYDLAVVVDENGSNDTVTFYRWEQGSEFQKATFNVNANFDAISGLSTSIGFESTSGINGRKSLDGIIENLAVWDRALSESEIHEAIGSPDPLWSLGIDGDSNVNFNNESSAGNDYTIGEPWGKLSRALTQYGNSQVDIHFDASAEQAALPYVFHLDTDGCRNPGLPATVLVNGQPLVAQQVVSNTDYQWYVRPELLQTGTNTLSLRYDGPYIGYGDGGTYATWDWLELGGSWQIGYDNGTSTEFSSEHDVADDFYVTDPNWKHFEQAVSLAEPDTYIHFFLSDEIAEHSFLLSFEALWAENNQTAFDVLLNGTTIRSSAGDLGLYQVPIDWHSRLMESGENILQFHFTDPRADHRWIIWDWVRLEVQGDRLPEPTSLSLLGLGALALLRRRRTH